LLRLMALELTTSSSVLFFVFFLLLRRPPSSSLFPYTTLFRSVHAAKGNEIAIGIDQSDIERPATLIGFGGGRLDRRLRPFHRNGRAVGCCERHFIGNSVEIGQRGRLLLGKGAAGREQTGREDDSCERTQRHGCSSLSGSISLPVGYRNTV